MKKALEDYEIFHLVRNNNFHGLSKESCRTYQRLKDILKKYQALFKDDLHFELPPEKNVDHENVIEGDGKPPHIPLFQLSPEELKDTE